MHKISYIVLLVLFIVGIALSAIGSKGCCMSGKKTANTKKDKELVAGHVILGIVTVVAFAWLGIAVFSGKIWTDKY